MVRSPCPGHPAEVPREQLWSGPRGSLVEGGSPSCLQPGAPTRLPELTVPAAAPRRWASSGAGPKAPKCAARPAGAAGSVGASGGLARTRALGPGQRCRGAVRRGGAGRPAACSHWHHSPGEHAQRPAARRRSERGRRSARPGPAGASERLQPWPRLPGAPLVARRR